MQIIKNLSGTKDYKFSRFVTTLSQRWFPRMDTQAPCDVHGYGLHILMLD